MPALDPAKASLRSIAEALRRRDFSAAALAERMIAQHRKAPQEAYSHWACDDIRTMAQAADDAFSRGLDHGRLQGIPISVKDLFGLTGMPSFAGSPRRLPERFEEDGPVVARIRAQAPVFTGKTLTSEFGFGVCGHNIHWGTPRNAWAADTVRPAGGSSTGAALSILEGSALIALGSDTGGSVREPANMAGIAGLKVTHGRWPIGGLIPPGPHLHGPGLLARSVADIGFAFAAIDRPEEPEALDALCERTALRDLRIGILDDYFWGECEPGIAESVEGAVVELERAGAKIVPCTLPQARELIAISADWDWGISAVELMEFMRAELPSWLETLHPGAHAQLRLSEAMSAIDYLGRCRELRRIRASADAALADFDVVLCPSSPMAPPLTAELEEPETYRRISRLAVRNMSIANLLDFCALTMPVGLDGQSLPVGLQLIARHGRDETLVAAAIACERILGTGRDRLGVPPLYRG